MEPSFLQELAKFVPETIAASSSSLHHWGGAVAALALFLAVMAGATGEPGLAISSGLLGISACFLVLSPSDSGSADNEPGPATLQRTQEYATDALARYLLDERDLVIVGAPTFTLDGTDLRTASDDDVPDLATATGNALLTVRDDAGKNTTISVTWNSPSENPDAHPLIVTTQE